MTRRPHGGYWWVWRQSHSSRRWEFPPGVVIHVLDSRQLRCGNSGSRAGVGLCPGGTASEDRLPSNRVFMRPFDSVLFQALRHTASAKPFQVASTAGALESVIGVCGRKNETGPGGGNDSGSREAGDGMRKEKEEKEEKLWKREKKLSSRGPKSMSACYPERLWK